MSEPSEPSSIPPESAAPAGSAAPRPHRRRNRLIVAGVVVVVVVWSAFAALQLIQARRHAQKGLDRLESAQHDLGPAQLIRGEGLGRMKAAQDEFDQAASAGDSFALKPFTVLPFVGRQVRSVSALTSSAAKVVDVGVSTMQASVERLKKPTTAGPDRVALVNELGAIASKARVQLRGLDLGPSEALLGPLAKARTKFKHQLDKVRTSMTDVDEASKGIGEMAQGPSKYLVLAANNSEMRAGSGMLLSAGVLTMQNGQFNLGPMTDTGFLPVPPGAVPISGDLAARWGWTDPSQEWRNLAMSPNFPANAELAAQMWKAKTGESVDGVIAIDPIGLKSLLEVSGPVVVDGQLVTTDNVVQETLLQSYLDYGPNVRDGDVNPNFTRRERSSAIARAIVDQLDAKGWDVAKLVDDLQHSAQGRHVLAWSSKPEQQRGWEAAGVSGRLRPDSLLLAVDNRAGNKLDQFLHVSAAFEHTPATAGSTVTVHIHIANQTPTTGLNEFVEGPYSSDFVAGEYSGILSVNIPGVSRAIHLDGGSKIVAAGPDGPTRVIATQMQLFRGEQKDYTLSFQVPTGYEHVTIEPSSRYPTVTWTADGQTWQDNSARTIRW